MRRYQEVLAGAVLALATAAGAAAYAQAAAQPRAGGGDRMERHERTMIVRHGDERPDRAEHLRAILQLKPAQEAALTAYLEAMHPKGDHDGMMRMRGEARPKTTPEKLARMEAHMTEHEAAMKTRIAATRRFYEQLDPAQKRAFDELPLMMGGPPMPMMGGMKVMHHPHPPTPPMPPRS